MRDLDRFAGRCQVRGGATMTRRRFRSAVQGLQLNPEETGRYPDAEAAR